MRRTLAWLQQLRILWWGVFVLAVSVAVMAEARPCGYETFERTIRVCGLVLQLVAVGTALVGLKSARRLFDLRPLGALLRIWWRSAPWRVGTSGHFSGNLILGSDAASGSLHSWAESNDSIPEAARLVALEQRTKFLLELTNDLRTQSRIELQELRDDVFQSISEQSRMNTITAVNLQHLALDGVGATAVGLSCAFLGIVLASASPELAKFFA